jgi:hypothetical protein
MSSSYVDNTSQSTPSSSYFSLSFFKGKNNSNNDTRNKPPLLEITKDYLIKNKITCHNLFHELKIPLSDLHIAYIIMNTQDLIDLKFKPKDLTFKRENININQVITILQLPINIIKEKLLDNMDITTIETCKFNAMELQLLDFDFDNYFNVENNEAYMDIAHLQSFNNLELSEFISLGLTTSHLKILKFKNENISKTFRCGYNDFCSAFNIKKW